MEQIERSLAWLGIDWDGPVTLPARRRSSAAGSRAARLVAEGKAYEDDGAIRFRMPDEGVDRLGRRGQGPDRVPERGARGHGDRPLRRPADLQLRLAGGRLDDGITHVIRGDDHVSNTPKQIVVPGARRRAAGVRARRRTSSARTARSSPSATAPSRWTSSATAGYIAPALMNFLALLGWAPDGETTIMSARRARRAVHARARRRQPGDVRLREARLDERRLPARARGRASTPTRSSRSCASRGIDWDEDGIRAAAPIVQEKIGRLGEFPDFAGFLFEDVEPDPDASTPRILRGRGRGARRGRAVDRRGDRGGAARRSATSSGRSRGPCTCRSASPSPARGSRRACYERLELLGRETSLARLRRGARGARRERARPRGLRAAPRRVPPASARRRRARCAWGRRRPPSRRRSSRATRTSSRVRSSRRSPGPRRRRPATRGSELAPAAPHLRGRDRRPRARRARGRARERALAARVRLGRRRAAAAVGAGAARGRGRLRRPRRARRAPCSRCRPPSTTSAARCSPRANELEADLTGVSPTRSRATRRRRASRCARCSTRSTRRGVESTPAFTP